MTPLELLARLAALVTPPRFPLLRFHGVFAPHSKKRALVVPGGDIPANEERPRAVHSHAHGDEKERAEEAHSELTTASGTERPLKGGRVSAPEPRGDPSAANASENAASDEATPLPSRIDWATLLHRVYDVDVVACPCGGQLEFLELVTDRAEIRLVLERLRLDDEPPESTGEPRIRGP